MGLFTRDRPAPPRIEPMLSAPERRAVVDYGPGWAGLATMAGLGGVTSPYAAEGLSAVLGCVGLIADSAASLPASIVVDGPDGRQPAPSTLPACRLISRPNARQSWPAFLTTLLSSVLLQGNGVARIDRDGRGAVVALTPIPWSWLMPQVINGASGPRLVFDVMHASPEAALLGLPARLLDTDVLHVRARSDNGIIGRSVLSRAAGVVRETLDVNEVAASTWRHGMRPSGALTTNSALDDVARTRLRAGMKEFTGSANVGKVLVLEQGLSWQSIALNPADAELLESRKFGVSEIARIFSVPEPMLQLGTRLPQSYTPIVAAFAQLALTPLVNMLEAEFDAAVLPAGYHLSIDMGGLLRGDYAAVAAAQAVLVQSGIATPNDARQALGLPAHDQGEELRPNGSAPSYPADASGVPSLAPKPGPGGGPLPHVGTNQNEGAG